MISKIIILIFGLWLSAIPAWSAQLEEVSVQLGWVHQANYAGFYMAEAKNYYESKGLDVTLVQGGATVNPIEELQNGNVDVAVSQLNDALLKNSTMSKVVNIAQIFSDTAMLMICRRDPGLMEPKDIVGKRIAVANWGDADLARAMIQAIKPGDKSTLFVPRGPNQLAINDGSADCMTGVSFNGYWSAVEKGISAKDMLILKPKDFGIYDLGDGLYVMRHRLESPEFRKKISAFLAATIKGWEDVKKDHAQAVTVILQKDPKLNSLHQHNMLEAVIDLIPQDIGLMGLEDYGRVLNSNAKYFSNEIQEQSEEQKIWTHKIWTESQEHQGLTPSTRYYLRSLSNSPWVTWLFIIGLMIYALAGTLTAMDYGFDLWGRLVVANLTCMGGGIIRDYFIGGERVPLKFISEPTLPICVLLMVLLITLVDSSKPKTGKNRLLHRFVNLPEYFGFGIVAIYGAIVSINAGMNIIWIPLCAALSIAGGGILRDIVLNREPVNFRGKIFEEAAIAGAIVLIALLYIANYYEESPVLVYLAVLMSILFTVVLHASIIRNKWHYPSWLGGSQKTAN